MKRNDSFDDAEIEALLAGRKPADRPEFDDLVEFIRTAKAVSHQAPSPDVERRHLAAIVEATTEAPMNELSRRRIMKSPIGSRWAKIATVTAIALGATTGLAAANVLPAAAQDALATAAEKVGFDLPRSSEKAHQNDGDSDATSDTEDGTEGETHDSASAGEENGKSVADDVHGVLEDDSLEGQEKGDAVSDAASQNRQNETHSHSRVGNPSPSPAGGPPAELPGGNPND